MKKSNSKTAPVWNSLTYGQKPKVIREMDSVSLTIPDQTMSTREIIDRYARGLPIQGYSNPKFNGEDGLGIDIRSLDLTERQELLIKGHIARMNMQQKQMDLEDAIQEQKQLEAEAQKPKEEKKPNDSKEDNKEK